MTVGDSFTFTATVKPDNATDKTVKWSSSNTSVLSIDPSTGKATAKAAGNSTITVKSADEKVKAEVFVTVVSPESTGKVTGLTLSTENGVDFVRHGKTIQLIPNYSPIGAYPAEAKWFSSNTEMATVDQSGLVKAISFNYSQSHLHYSQNGYPEVTISLQADGLMAIFKLKILPAVPEKIIVQNPPPSTMTIGDTWDMGQITIIPAEAEQSVNINYRYETGNSQGFTGGGPSSFVAEYALPLNIQIQANGTHAQAVYTGTDINYYISVKPIYETSIKLSRSSYKVETGSIFNLFYEIFPESASYKDVTWTSSNPSVATVDGGCVRALSPGTTQITAKSHHGKTASCSVNVEQRTNDISVGDYYYSDGTTSSSLNPSKTVVGVVCSLLDAVADDPNVLAKDHPSCTHGLVISLDEYDASIKMSNGDGDWVGANKWAQDNGYRDFYLTDAALGYSNTKALLKYKEASGNYIRLFGTDEAYQRHKSAYSISVETSGWYLPSFVEMEAIAENFSKVSASLKAVKASYELRPGDRYWISTQTSNSWMAKTYVLSNAEYYQESFDGGTTYVSVESMMSSTRKVRFIFAF
jgi:uncharacterized protein YjdB